MQKASKVQISPIEKFSKQILLFALSLICLFSACETAYLPKPYGYNKIILPPFSYHSLGDTLPYRFEVNTLSQVSPDLGQFSEKYWLDIDYPSFDASIQITYKPLSNSQKELEEFLNDAFRLTSKHQVRAYSIEESIIVTPNNKTGVIAELSGEVPTPFQFFSTDSTSHFLRAALYFNTATKNDSLAPVIDYLKQDMVHMLNTLEWKNE
jgi:gliding motility-associated lipoprotein GldD